MAKEFDAGDQIEWGGRADPTRGKIKRKLTAHYKIKNYDVPATADDPWYLIETDRTGAEAAHKPDSLRKVGD
ncbi:MAG: DUF2945 domain-containing protein [Chloroflexia bacterium]|nr:DUF2945 domain-containing protein [Chloroflexia bacterium]